MSLSNAKKLVEKLAKDSKFKEAFTVEAKRGDKNALIAFAKKSRIECTERELKEVFGGRHHSF